MAWINHGETYYPGIDKIAIERIYHAKFVCELAHRSNGGWTDYPVQIYYENNPPEGYSNYFAIYKAGGKIMITSAAYVVGLPINGLETSSGEIIYSGYRHDYKKAKTADVAIDGGFSYRKVAGSFADVKSVVLTIKGSEMVVVSPKEGEALHDAYFVKTVDGYLYGSEGSDTIPKKECDIKEDTIQQSSLSLNNCPSIIYARQPLPKSIFLAGPSPRSKDVKSWRPEAIEAIREYGFNGNVYSPEDGADDDRKFDYDSQVKWEWEAMACSTVVMFWVPRDMATLPGLVTNVEFGMLVSTGKVILGCPQDGTHNKYLIALAARYGLPVYCTLGDTVAAAIEKASAPYGKEEV